MSSLPKAVTCKRTGRGSNRRPFGSRANALPLSHTGHNSHTGVSKNNVLPSGTLSQTMDLLNFLPVTPRHNDRPYSVVNLISPSQVYHTERPQLFATLYTCVARVVCDSRASCKIYHAAAVTSQRIRHAHKL